ncbi:hypothetical protein [Owenweeksia hongkongensis]|uniref:hypothetical protein n=1 Tax=Owenweeksia hongkongensis TaxID=253245 RepID=UPI003A90A968
MRKILYILIAGIGLAACLKKDILADDLSGTNFKQSEFYTSGQFVNMLDMTVSSTRLEIITNGLGDTLCKTFFTGSLEETFVQALDENWDGEIQIVQVEDTDFTSNPRRSFTLRGAPAECDADSSTAEIEILLVDPNTQRITVRQNKILTLPIVR